MNPKEMTNEQLVHRSEDRGAYVMEHGQDVGLGVHNELLHRLNEFDALRKENAVIRADNADLLAKQDAFVFVHNNMASDMDALRKENEELRKDKARLDFLDDGNYGIDPRNIPGVQMNGRRFHCLAGRGDWNTLREAIDAARLAKECEAKNG